MIELTDSQNEVDKHIFHSTVIEEENIIATYYIESKDLLKSAKSIAIGQSIGNPDIRTQRDSPEILKKNMAKILDTKNNLQSMHKGVVKIAYPVINWDPKEDGITHLLCTLMGGQMDIDIIDVCRLIDIELPEDFTKYFKGPKFGMDNIKKRAKAANRPLLGSIIKPKTGLTVDQLKELVKELLRGGVDFIKEDEILANPNFCKFEERVEIVSNIVNDFSDDQGREIFYTPCINGDYPYFLDRARFADKIGVRAVHLNIWAGLPAYRALRDLDMKHTAIFFQKSGDKVITGEHNAFSIHWNVVCKLARLMGADFIHAGMWGCYLSDSKEELAHIFNSLRGKNRVLTTVPSLSCGSHPGLVDSTIKNFGTEIMMTVGGSIHGHPMGSEAGARAMRQAFDCVIKGENIKEYMMDKPELKAAIEKWGVFE